MNSIIAVVAGIALAQSALADEDTMLCQTEHFVEAGRCSLI